MSSNAKLKTIILDALKNARENDYPEVDTMPAEELAQDLLNYCGDIEGEDQEVLVAIIKEIRSEEKS